MMDFRSKLLADRPLTQKAALATKVASPPKCQDSQGAPPVVVWLAPVPVVAPVPRVVRRRASEWEASGGWEGGWQEGGGGWKSATDSGWSVASSSGWR